MEFSKPEYWSGLPFPSPGDLPKPGIKPMFLALQADSLPALWLRTLEFCWLLAVSGTPTMPCHRTMYLNRQLMTWLFAS